MGNWQYNMCSNPVVTAALARLEQGCSFTAIAGNSMQDHGCSDYAANSGSMVVGLSNYRTLLSLGIGSNSWMWDALYSGFENFEQA